MKSESIDGEGGRVELCSHLSMFSTLSTLLHTRLSSRLSVYEIRTFRESCTVFKDTTLRQKRKNILQSYLQITTSTMTQSWLKYRTSPSEGQPLCLVNPSGGKVVFGIPYWLRMSVPLCLEWRERLKKRSFVLWVKDSLTHFYSWSVTFSPRRRYTTGDVQTSALTSKGNR